MPNQKDCCSGFVIQNYKMSDKRKAIIQIYTTKTPENIEDAIKSGYTTRLVFRKPADEFSVFDAISGVS